MNVYELNFATSVYFILLQLLSLLFKTAVSFRAADVAGSNLYYVFHLLSLFLSGTLKKSN
jgi:hypothetical protein